MPEHHPEYNVSFAVYYSSKLPALVLLRQDLVNILPKNNWSFTAYNQLNIHFWEYVVFHEIYHHISGKQDSDEFEKELYNWIITFGFETKN